MRHIIVTAMLASLLFVSCDMERKKAERDIARRVGHAETLLAGGSLQAARMELDSIHQLYPRMVDARRQAKALDDTITLRESRRTLAYCDSLLPVRQQQADSMQRQFYYERDETYETVGRYVYRALRVESNIGRTYLRAHVDDNADFFLVSNFTGTYRLEHVAVKASVGDTYATTDSIPVDSPFSHSFDDEGTYWEIVTFKNEAAGTLPAFVAGYATERIKITLQGRGEYAFFLSETDKKALKATYELWMAKKDLALLQREIEKAQATIARLEN